MLNYFKLMVFLKISFKLNDDSSDVHVKSGDINMHY